jgi:translation initiation factor eIF-2B subunit delta
MSELCSPKTVLSKKTEDILDAIETNTDDGAAVLAARGLDALGAALPLLRKEPRRARETLFDLTRRIGALRPAMGAIGVQALLATAHARDLLEAGRASDWPSALEEALASARALLADSERRIAALALERIGPSKRLLTCSYSSTVMKVFEVLEPTDIFIGEGHPLGDGARAARALAQRGAHPTLVPDGGLPNLVEEADAVLIGADQVLADGAVVNRASSFAIALAAHHFNVPFFVVCQRIKITGVEKSAVSMEEYGRAPENLPRLVAFKAPLFDITPPTLVSEIVTEQGVLSGVMIGELSRATAALRKDICEGPKGQSP